MIRDPSDGSVREEKRSEGINLAPNKINTVATKKPEEEIASGLPFGSTKPENVERLERSREWLKLYRKGEIPNDATG